MFSYRTVRYTVFMWLFFLGSSYAFMRRPGKRNIINSWKTTDFDLACIQYLLADDNEVGKYDMQSTKKEGKSPHQQKTKMKLNTKTIDVSKMKIVGEKNEEILRILRRILRLRIMAMKKREVDAVRVLELLRRSCPKSPQ